MEQATGGVKQTEDGVELMLFVKVKSSHEFCAFWEDLTIFICNCFRTFFVECYRNEVN